MVLLGPNSSTRTDEELMAMRSPGAQLTAPLTVMEVLPTSAVAFSWVQVGVLCWPCKRNQPSRTATT